MKSIIKISGTIIMFFITVNFYIILTTAMVLGNDAVNVYFNIFGEAMIEYIMYALLFPIIVYSLYLHVKEYRKGRKGAKHVKKIPSRDTTNSVGDYSTK